MLIKRIQAQCRGAFVSLSIVSDYLDMPLSDLNLVARATSTVKGGFKKYLMYAASCSTNAAISARGGTNRCPSCSHLFWKIHFQVNEQRADLFHKRWHRCDRWNKDQQF